MTPQREWNTECPHHQLQAKNAERRENFCIRSTAENEEKNPCSQKHGSTMFWGMEDGRPQCVRPRRIEDKGCPEGTLLVGPTWRDKMCCEGNTVPCMSCRYGYHDERTFCREMVEKYDKKIDECYTRHDFKDMMKDVAFKPSTIRQELPDVNAPPMCIFMG